MCDEMYPWRILMHLYTAAEWEERTTEKLNTHFQWQLRGMFSQLVNEYLDMWNNVDISGKYIEFYCHRGSVLLRKWWYDAQYKIVWPQIFRVNNCISLFEKESISQRRHIKGDFLANITWGCGEEIEMFDRNIVRLPVGRHYWSLPDICCVLCCK